MWLPLAEYSLKNKVSISTLRRKIKASNIEYRLDDGKYFILDSEEDAPRPSLSRESSFSEQTHPPAQAPVKIQAQAQTETQHQIIAEKKPVVVEAAAETGESVITTANRLLTDLKKAYTQVLQDKEVQILTLKEEISDLKTLIKVLESENDRHRNHEELNN
jgi:hypothetical protein